MLSTEQIKEIEEQAFLGVPSQLPDEICYVKPYTIKEYITIGSTNFSFLLGTLLSSEQIAKKTEKGEGEKEEKRDGLKAILSLADTSPQYYAMLEKSFSFFITEPILLVPKEGIVIVGDVAGNRKITSENFEDFLTILKIQNNISIEPPPPENETEGEKKMRLLREKRDAVKKKQLQSSGETPSLTFFFELAEVYGIDYQNKTFFAFFKILKRYQLKEKWDQDFQVLCAGGKSNKIKPKYWASEEE